jgi:hypothetical protein
MFSAHDTCWLRRCRTHGPLHPSYPAQHHTVGDPDPCPAIQIRVLGCSIQVYFFEMACEKCNQRRGHSLATCVASQACDADVAGLCIAAELADSSLVQAAAVATLPDSLSARPTAVAPTRVSNSFLSLWRTCFFFLRPTHSCRCWQICPRHVCRGLRSRDSPCEARTAEQFA